jgi:hypothetical protein
MAHFPTSWKLAIVHSINKAAFKEYRSISLLSHLEKLSEKIIS